MCEGKKFKIPTTGYGADGKIHKFPNPGQKHDNDLIGTKIREMMRATTMDTAVREVIHFMYNDYKVTVEKQEEASDE